MKPNKILALITLLCISTSSMAQGKPKQIGETVTRSVELTFKSPEKINLKITPFDNLNSGKINDNTMLINYDVTSYNIHRMAIRFTPSSGKVNGDNGITINGKGKPGNTLSLKLLPNTPSKIQGDWLISREQVTIFQGGVVTSGEQIVYADTYTVSLDATVFSS